MDDVHAIADQVAKSPVVGQIKDIWNQASKTFFYHYDQRDPKRTKAQGRFEKPTRFKFVQERPMSDVSFPHGMAHAPVLRSSQQSGFQNPNHHLRGPENEGQEDQQQEVSQRRNESPHSQEAREQRRQAANALVDLGRNASVYLRSLQKVLENL